MPESLSLRGMKGLKASFAHLAWEFTIVEDEFGQRKFATELYVLKVGHAGEVLSARTEAITRILAQVQVPVVGRLEISVEHTGINYSECATLYLLLSFNREVGKTVDACLCWGD